MGALDQVTELKNKGVSDSEIVKTLQEQGVSPADITDALSRAQIKSAVSSLNDSGESTEGMEHSILQGEDEPDRLPTEGNITDADLTPPTPIGFGRSGQMPMYATKEIPGDSSEMYVPQEGYYAPQAQYPQLQEYPGQQQSYAYSGGIADTDTMMEVAEQVFSEKNKPLQKKIDEMNEFRALTQTKLDYISERLKKIETVIDSLQASILEKVGSYGSGLESIKKEMSMMQDSFGKVVNRVADKKEERYSSPARQKIPSQSPDISEEDFTLQKSKKTTRKVSKK